MRVFVYYDVSGSIPEELLNRFLFEAEWRRSILDHDEWLEFGFDTSVFPFQEFIDPEKMIGCGGTSSQAVYDHWVAHAQPEDGFLLLTDGYIPPMKIIPGHGPVEFVVIEYPLED